MKGKQSGSAIIEAMIALVLLSVGLLATAKMQLNMGLASQLARQRMEATNYASNVLEELRAKVACADASVGSKKPLQSSTTYTVRLTTCTTKSATVLVTWTDARGNQKKIQDADGNDTDNRIQLSTQF